MKRFMYLSVGLLCLSISTLVGFLIGGGSATAQSQVVVGYSTDGLASMFILDASGDVWRQQVLFTGGEGGCGVSNYVLCSAPPTYMGNFWGQQPIPTSPSTMGGVKGKYR